MQASGNGAEIIGGVGLLQKENPTIREFYDTKHKAAYLLKALLAVDPRWKDFQHQLGEQCWHP